MKHTQKQWQSPPSEDVAFERWRMAKVISVVGISRSTILRRIEAGSFPKPYKGQNGELWWASTQVIAWNHEQLRYGLMQHAGGTHQDNRPTTA